MKNTEDKYLKWLELAVLDSDLINELKHMNKDMIHDAFYRDLEFGTGGLRGVIGAGTNRINIYTVAKATQGLANYIKNNFPKEKWKVAIAYDSRNKSDLFASFVARVLAANDISVYLHPVLMPVPVLSFTTRYYGCANGVMITASHNPAKYNGYKVYGSDGCQITTEAAKEILSYINDIDEFDDVKLIDLKQVMNDGLVSYVSQDVLTSFIEEVKKLSMINGKTINKEFSIVYSPLHGAGLIPVTRILKECGYNNVIVVKEQELPDGNFTTCPYPNPEIKEAMSLGMDYARKYNADLLLATDPDCDRVGIAVKDGNDYKLITGNETGVLLLDYICSRLVETGKMPTDPVLIKTIVTTDMAEKIAKHYGLSTINVLTGFKFIGEQIGFLEQKNQKERFVFGFEESYGVLSGTHVRDKDAVDGAFLICEMFAFYKTKGITLLEKLDELYKTYGYYFNTLHNYEFEGESGFNKMQNIMNVFRNSFDIIDNRKVIKTLDYSLGIDNLPKSNVIKFFLEDGSTIVARPSGTEPKLKIYISIVSNQIEDAKNKEKTLILAFENVISSCNQL